MAPYNFITPNLCNDMHDSCSPLRNRVAQGDTWLAQHLPEILNSQAFGDGGAVFLTWDEGDKADGPMGMIGRPRLRARVTATRRTTLMGPCFEPWKKSFESSLILAMPRFSPT